MSMDDHKQIGEAAERTGLSLRTIRYYEEVGLITPSARSHGGFRLYTDSDIARLMLVKRMKPLGFSLDEMRDLLGVLDELDRDDLAPAARASAHERLGMFEAAADERCASLRSQLETAEEFAHSLRRESRQQARHHESAGRDR
ncbi:MerR family transcriptional regulator [Demequina aestuarii]|uniref:MerR family transcriptional regulator n=1 Tax=Demequina aestuarii TaxID=327095 RepID=UPI00078450AE